jgi:hypothetical protein
LCHLCCDVAHCFHDDEFLNVEIGFSQTLLPQGFRYHHVWDLQLLVSHDDGLHPVDFAFATPLVFGPLASTSLAFASLPS